MAAWFNSQVMLPIFKRLDLKSLVSCNVTCKTWKNYLAIENFFNIEVILHLVERFNGDVIEWQSFLKRSKTIRRIKVNTERNDNNNLKLKKKILGNLSQYVKVRNIVLFLDNHDRCQLLGEKFC